MSKTVAIKSVNNKVAALKNKYEKYISNIQWHIDTNKPDDGRKAELEKQIEYFREFLNDLKFL